MATNMKIILEESDLKILRKKWKKQVCDNIDAIKAEDFKVGDEINMSIKIDVDTSWIKKS